MIQIQFCEFAEGNWCELQPFSWHVKARVASGEKAEVGNYGAFFFVSFAFGELAGYNFLKNKYLSILLGSFGRAKEMKNQITKLLDIKKVQRCV